MENKQEILDALLPALQKTRQCSDLIGLEFQYIDKWDNSQVVATFEHGIKRIMVSGDSGIAMIDDVIHVLMR